MSKVKNRLKNKGKIIWSGSLRHFLRQKRCVDNCSKRGVKNAS